MVLAKIVEDPHSGTCLNVSYADINGPVANPNPTGSPFANTPMAPHSPNGSFHQNNNAMAASAGAGIVSGLSSLLGGGVNLTLNLSSAFPGGGVGNPIITGQLLEHVRTVLRGAGFSEPSGGEVCGAIATLINYGIIGLGLGLGGVPGSNQGNQHMMQPLMGSNNADSYHGGGGGAGSGGGVSNGNNGPFGPIGTTVASGLNLGQGLGGPTSPQRQVDRFGTGESYDPFRRQSGDTNLPLNANSFGLGTPLRKSPTPGDLAAGGAADAGTAKDVEMEVGEHIVGAILGPGGKNLVEIQHLSGTVIQISKKGNYAPGTRNRVVTISGRSAAVARAQFLIEQRISEEESKRARQNAIMTSMN
ncbi:hypothetical protein HAZT_HAZT009628 [Hyalella azteca]|uniref:K Homology domain-containing protein n=1 Tax=Hyalella azteca TaxID=294128 RepID=A0A6A0GT94_HYAAZ|nr:hypothetical protein HAZT_HAZT009628 [Hyalella azteca]